MRGRLIAAIVFLLFTISALGQITRAAPRGPSSWLAVQNSELANANFEGSFSARHDPYSGTWAGELEVADGWDLWYDNRQACPTYDPGCNPLSYNRRPEFKPEPVTGRVHGGQKAQKFFTTYGTHTAGLYQRVRVPANSWVRFSIWVWAWSSQKDIANHSFQPGDYAVTVGIDPRGGTDWRSDDIIWRTPLTRHDEWVYLELDAYTRSGDISVWTKGSQVWPVKHNDSYWDDARLVVLPSAPAPTPTNTPTRTPQPTPEATPEGYEPPPCSLSWSELWHADFEQPTLTGWGVDPAKGAVAVQDGALQLRNGSQVWEAFPLAWLERSFPTRGDLRFSFRFRYSDHTAYGSSIGIGSEPYHGERVLAGASSPVWRVWGLALEDVLGAQAPQETLGTGPLAGALSTLGTENILSISHRSTAPGEGDFSIKLMGNTVWSGTPGDSGWHSVQLELREHTYIVQVDDQEVGRAVSYWRPQSFFAGNPVILWIKGFWTEVALDDVTLSSCCTRTMLPLLMQRYAFPTPERTATPTAEPSATATESPAATPSPSKTASPQPTVTPSVTVEQAHTLTATPSGTEEASKSSASAP